MRSHLRWCAVSVPFTLVVCAASGAVPKAQQAATSSSASAWAAPLTPDGRPDLQGVWTNATLTPLERPKQLADRAFLTEDEAAALEAQAAGRQAAADDREPSAGAGQGRHRQLQPVLVRLRHHDPAHPADLARRRSAGWPGARPSRGRSAARRRARAQHRRARVHEHVGPLHLTWCARAGSSRPATTTPTRSCRRRTSS